MINMGIHNILKRQGRKDKKAWQNKINPFIRILIRACLLFAVKTVYPPLFGFLWRNNYRYISKL